MIIGGVVFGYFAGLTYWFPKLFGFKLDEKLGKCAFWCWIVGFYVAFMPLYVLGLMGMTRRLNHYSEATGFHPYLVVAAVGAFVIGLGVMFQIMQLVVSIRKREEYRDLTGDAWDARTLEWSIPSPAPFYNFAITPHVDDRDAFWEHKRQLRDGSRVAEAPHYEDIHMPRNTPTGFFIAMFAGAFGFGMVWHILWLIVFGLLGIVVTMLRRSLDFDVDYYVKAEEVAKIEAEYAERAKQARHRDSTPYSTDLLSGAAQ